MGTNVYMFKNVLVDAGGVQVVDFAEGDDVIKVEIEEARIKPYVGADGGNGLNVSPKKSGTITLKLMATSPVLNYFATLYSSLDITPILVPILIKSSQGAEFVLADVLIDKIDIGYGSEWPVREVKLVSSEITIFPAALAAAVNV